MEKDPFKKLNQFFSQFKLFHYQKHEMILRADDTPQGVYYLKKGYTRLFSISSEGEELTLIIFKPEDFFPLMWAINNSPNVYYLEAVTAVELWRAPKNGFLAFVKDNPEVLLALTSRILTRLGGLLTRMEYLVFGNSYAKVASILVICAERFGQRKESEVNIQVPLTHRDIASLVGITRETTSLELKKLEKKGIITYHGRLLTIKNIKSLEKESLLGRR